MSDPDSYCIAVNRTGAHLIRLGSSRGRIELLAREYLDEVKAKQRADQNARRLYAMLLAPITNLRTKARILVVPDGVLHLVPFDALQGTDGKYVLESAVVSYAPSATVLHFLRSHQRSRPTRRASLANRCCCSKLPRCSITLFENTISNEPLSYGKFVPSPTTISYLSR